MRSSPSLFEWQKRSRNSFRRQFINITFLTLNNVFLLRLNPISHLFGNLIPNLTLISPLHNKPFLLFRPFKSLLQSSNLIILGIHETEITQSTVQSLIVHRLILICYLILWYVPVVFIQLIHQVLVLLLVF